jgi:hypothetical protein
MTEPDRAEPADARDDAEGQSKLEIYFRPVIEDEGLRPVVISVLIGLATVIGWGLLLAVRDRKPTAIAAIVLLAMMTTEWVVRAKRNNGRLGAAGWSVVVIWIASAGFAIGGHVTGYL